MGPGWLCLGKESGQGPPASLPTCHRTFQLLWEGIPEAFVPFIRNHSVRVTLHGQSGRHLAICRGWWEKGPGWTEPCPQAMAAHVLFHWCLWLRAKCLQGMQEVHLPSKKGEKESRAERNGDICEAFLQPPFLWEPLGAPRGISHLTYRPHQNQLSLWVRFGLEEAARPMNSACSYWEGYGRLCHIIIFTNPLSFILKLARAQFLLFLLEGSSKVLFLCPLEIM